MRIFLFISFLSLQITQLILAQDFKSTFVQDGLYFLQILYHFLINLLDFLPIPLAAPLADSVDGELKQDPRCLEQNEIGNGTGESWLKGKYLNVKIIKLKQIKY